MALILKTLILSMPLLFGVCNAQLATATGFVDSTDYVYMTKIKSGFTNAASVFASWISTNPCSKWNGVLCDANGKVTSIILENYGNFNGSLSSYVGSLSKLLVLSLPGNGITGAIPSSIGSLNKLTTLNLARNSITGSIPSTITGLIKCTTLILSYNQLTGTLPTMIIPQFVVTELRLDHNQFVGTIPVSLTYHYSHAKRSNYTLDLSSNLLTGGFSITYQGRYLTLNVSNNYLSGPATVKTTEGHHCPNADFGHNCLSKAFVKTSCSVAKEQKTKRQCSDFCNATYANGGACRKGVCNPPTATKRKPYCSCLKGYSNSANKYTCK